MAGDLRGAAQGAGVFPSTAVVTGPTGVVGVALVSLLLERGCSVVAVCRPGSARKANLPADSGLQVVELSLSDIGSLPVLLESRGVRRADVFFHLGWGATFGAARDDLAVQMENVSYALAAVDVASALGCSVFVGAGSQAEYGRSDVPLAPDTPTVPESGYGTAKLAACHLTRLRCEQLGIRQNWVRLLSVYGPCELPGTVVSSAIDALLRGEAPRLTECRQTWDFLYADDAARGLLAVAERGRPSAVYVLGSGEARPLRDYMEALRDAVDPAAPLDFGAVPYREGQVMHLSADIGQLAVDTGFRPSVPFEVGIRATVEWRRRCGRGQLAEGGVR